MAEFNDNRLRYLHEAVRCGTMRAASESLDVAPSSISRQIAQLEDELGVTLIERGRRTIRLTEAGEIAYAYYRERVSQQEAFLSRLSDIRGLREGTVHLAVGEGFIGDLLIGLLRRYMDEYPAIRISTRIAATTDVARLIVEDEAHIGLVFQCPPDAKLRVRASSAQPLKVLFRPGHAFDGRATVGLAEVAEQPLSLPDRSFRIRQLLGAAESAERVLLQPKITSNSLLILKDFARSGTGVTILPSIAAYSEIQAGTLRSAAIDHPALSDTEASVVVRLGRQLPISANRLLQAIEATMPFLPTP